MKKLAKILLLSVLSMVLAFCAFACGDEDTDKLKGFKMSLKVEESGNYYVLTAYGDDASVNVNGKVEIPSTWGEDGKVYPVTKIRSNVFSGNNTIKELVVPTSIEEIAEGAFSNMQALEKLTVPFIGRFAKADAFYNDTDGAPDKATEKERTFGYFFGNESFNNACKLTQVYNVGESDSFTYYISNKLKEVSIDSKDNYTLPMYAFNGNVRLEKVNLSEKVVKIGDYAFYGNSFLKDIVIPKDVEYIGNFAFADCSSLSGFKFETGFEGELVIGNNAFSNAGLNTIKLPDSTVSIGARCFMNSTVKAVMTKLTIIPEYAFYGCQKLIGFNAMQENTIKLTGVTAGAFAFANLNQGTEYTVINGDISSNVFYNTNASNMQPV